jgi:hypothetical protein
MDPRAVLAARNNAEWCDLVCRTHGVGTRFEPDAWVALRRSPPLYPDAVTLTTGPAGALLGRVDSSQGCSIKDSFATLDLSAAGFRVLFEAEWIHRRPPPQPTGGALRWSRVRTPDELLAWSAAHGGVFGPALLDNPAVAILAARDEAGLVAGVIGNRSESVVGVSNFFATTAATDRAWAGAIAAVSAQFPGLPLVGYEHGSGLGAAHRAGFLSVGRLRVWLKD